MVLLEVRRVDRKRGACVRYDEIYATSVERAIKTADVSFDAFIKNAMSAGMSEAAIERRLLDDLREDGPIFGAFFRSIEGAAVSSAMAAERQGAYLAGIDGNKELSRLLDLGSLEDVIDEADPAELDAIERATEDRVVERWVATMVKTCHRCLPLHGKVMTRAQWKEAGYLPETIHDGWNSVCQCRLVPYDEADSHEELVAPLLRVAKTVKDERGTVISKKTVRAVTQLDLQRSIAARDEAMKSEAGRRTLRVLGTAQGEE